MQSFTPQQALVAAVRELRARSVAVNGLLVACSGGADSLAALLIARSYCQDEAIRLRAIHVHHGLSPHADAWAQQVLRLTSGLEVECVLRQVEVVAHANLEAAARVARYQAFREELRAGEVLLLAHHAGDQAETLLLNWLRGAGGVGASGMPMERPLGAGHLLRPFLTLTRAQLRAVITPDLPVVVDESNTDRRFSRVWLRTKVLPALRARWPAAEAQLARTADRLGDEQRLLRFFLRQELTQCMNAAGGLSVAAVEGRLASHGQRVFVEWLRLRTTQLPDADRLDEFWRQARSALPDRGPRLALMDGEVRRYRGHVYWLPRLASAKVNQPEALAWAGLPLSLSVGDLKREAVATGGLRWPQAGLQIRFRQGGERMVWRRGQHRQVKDLLREAGVPPWLRSRWPLLFCEEELICVPQVGMAPHWQAKAGQGYVIVFTPSSTSLIPDG